MTVERRWPPARVVPETCRKSFPTVERRWPEASAEGWRHARMIGGRPGRGLRRASDDRERTAARSIPMRPPDSGNSLLGRDFSGADRTAPRLPSRTWGWRPAFVLAPTAGRAGAHGPGAAKEAEGCCRSTRTIDKSMGVFERPGTLPPRIYATLIAFAQRAWAASAAVPGSR
jgi:hypothetical protein